MSAWSAKLGDAVSGAIRATAFVVMVAAVVIVVAPRLQMPSSGAVQDDDDKAAAAPDTSADPRVVTLDRDGQEKGGIATADPAPTTFQDQVRAYGTVLPLDRIVALYNAALTSSAQLEMAKAKQGESRAANERAQALLKAFSTAKAQAETAAATAEIDTAGVATATAQIEALHNTAVQEWGPVLGEAIVARSKLAADLVARRLLLVQLSVQPGAVVTPPQALAFALGDGPKIEGRFVADATQADPKVQNVGYLYAVPAAPALLSGASILAYLPKGAAEAGYGIPSSAVVWQAGKPWMYVRTAPDKFVRRSIGEVAEPTLDGGYVVPAKRFSGQEPQGLVTAGAQALLSQEMRTQIPSEDAD